MCPVCYAKFSNLQRMCERGDDVKSILFLRLDPEFDPTRALRPQDDLRHLFQDSCKDYVVLPEVVFQSTDELIRELKGVNNRSLAHVSILTHGAEYSITTGRRSMHMFDPECTELIEVLREKLAQDASILLCACKTGKVHKINAYPQTNVDENRPMTLYNFRNWFYPNFACMLAFRLLNHPVYCTPNEQTRDELVAKFSSSCVHGQTPKILYVSSRQSMYRYINSTDKGTENTLSDPLELSIEQVDLVFDLRGGGRKFASEAKEKLREYERKNGSRCLSTRRSINAYLNSTLH